MKLEELSEGYRYSAELLRSRLRQLRQEASRCQDPGEKWHLQQRIRTLTPILTQMNELAELTARYYERGFWRSEKYTL